MNEPTLNSEFVSSKGGELQIVDEKSGEVLLEVAIPPGIVPAREYVLLTREILRHASADARVNVSENLFVREPRGGYGFEVHPLAYESAANPDYQPTSADRLQRQMRHNMAQLAAQQSAIEKKLSALAAIERVPQAPAEKPAEKPAEGEGDVVE